MYAVFCLIFVDVCLKFLDDAPRRLLELDFEWLKLSIK